MFYLSFSNCRRSKFSALAGSSVLAITLALAGCGSKSASDLIHEAVENYNTALSVASSSDRLSRLQIAFDLATEAKTEWPDDSSTKSFLSQDASDAVTFSKIETALNNTFRDYRTDCIRGPNIQCVYVIAHHMVWTKHDNENAISRISGAFSTKTQAQIATSYINNLASGSFPDDRSSPHIENLVAIGRPDIAKIYWSKDKNLSTISFDDVMSCFSKLDSKCDISFSGNDQKIAFLFILRKMFIQSGRPADFYKIALSYYKDDASYWLSDHLVKDFEDLDTIRSNIHTDDDKQTLIDAFSLASDMISIRNKGYDALKPFLVKTAIENRSPEESFSSIINYMSSKKDVFSSEESVYSGCRFVSALYGIDFASKYDDYTGDNLLNGKRVCGTSELLSSYPDEYDQESEQKFKFALSNPEDYFNMSSHNRKSEIQTLLSAAKKSLRAYILHTIKWNLEMAERSGIYEPSDVQFEINLYDMQDKIRFICRSNGDGSELMSSFEGFKKAYPKAKIAAYVFPDNIDPVVYVCNRGIYDYYLDTENYGKINDMVKNDVVSPEQYIRHNDMFMSFSRWSRFALSIEDTDTGIGALSSVLDRFM